MSLATLITCTGNRSDAFELCKRYMKAQKYYNPIQWIVVHDEEGDFFSGANTETKFELYRGPKPWKPGLNTQRYNTEEALKHVKGEYILIIEDDDFYSPNYISTMVSLLQNCDIVGEAHAKYYNLQFPGYKEMRNTMHASLCQTAFKRSVLPLFEEAVNSGEMYFDIALWRKVHEKRIPAILLHHTDMVIGIKGMPGRDNIGAGGKTKDFLLDPNLAKLEEWCGVSASNYLPFIKRKNDRPKAGNTPAAEPVTPKNRIPTKIGTQHAGSFKAPGTWKIVGDGKV